MLFLSFRDQEYKVGEKYSVEYSQTSGIRSTGTENSVHVEYPLSGFRDQEYREGEKCSV